MARKPVFCSICGVLGHYQYQCFRKKQKKIKKVAKPVIRKPIQRNVDWKWIETKNKWFKANPSLNGFYYCHYCHKVLVRDDELNDYGVEYVTLDHKKPKGNIHGRSLKYDIDNLVPCCYPCNSLKGSRSYESFCKEFHPHLLLDSRE
jgi:5-methylcytosine-specific restriction endonuclease McrA